MFLPLSRTYALLAGLLATGSAAAAQTHWTVDPKRSLAWWEVNPHLSHLWATTCPEEPSWQPGDGRSDGWTTVRGRSRKYEGNVGDTTRIPLFPRTTARPLCTEAVEGKVLVTNRAQWEGIQGQVTVRAAALVTGHNRRDEYARTSVLQTNTFPDIRFSIDSLVIATRNADSLTGKALGSFTLRGVTRPVTATVRAWPEGGGMRVLARFHIPAHDLVPVYGFSVMALGLGIGAKIWQYVFAGVDLVLLPDEPAP